MWVLYGDNQFLGVNHQSSIKSTEYQERFRTPEQIAEVLAEAYEAGLRDFMFTLHPKTLKALKLIYQDCPFQLHLCLPYAHSINDRLTQLGMVGFVHSVFRTSGYFSSISAGFNALFGKYRGVVKIGLESEVSQYKDFNIKSINMLNIATDFLIGSRRYDLIEDFYNVVKDDFKCEAGFFTMNYPKVADKVWGDLKLSDANLIFNFNEGGFRMNPSRNLVVECVNKYRDKNNIAMSLFGSGSSLSEMQSFISMNPGIKGALFGSASIENIKSNMDVLSKI